MGVVHIRKLLVVDDEPSLRFLVSSTLEDEGYVISEAEDGLAAFEAICVEKPDLIILDVMMPGLSGYELCVRLKQNPLTADIKIILLTAKGQEEDRLRSQQVGADYYLRKPFSPMHLIAIVEDLFK